MIRIRFSRKGLKRQPVYRLVVSDQRNARDGDFLEVIGHHNPRTRPQTDIVNEARMLYWLSVGAQPTDAVLSVIKRTGTWDRFQRMRKGEAIEALVEEAAKTAKPLPSPKTSFLSPEAGQGKKAKAAAAAESK